MGKFEELDQFTSLEELANHKKTVTEERQGLDAEYDVQPMPEDILGRFTGLTETIDEIDRRVKQREMRLRVLEEAASDPNKVERIGDGEPKIHAPAVMKDHDIWDLTSIRANTPERATQEMRDRARRANDIASYWAAPDRQKAQTHVENLILRDEQSAVSEYVLITGNPTYRSAWFKHFAGMPLTNAEASIFTSQRALSLTGSAGGFAVPFVLDPTILGTSNGSVNPLRSIARVESINVDEWRGVSSGAITAAYAAEATETTDNAPTLAQPTISTEKAQAFIPFSIEVGMDWPSLENEMGRLLQEAKDDLEATKFFLGSGTNEPFGVIVGATNTITATTPQTMDAEDLYRLSAALPPRYQGRASVIANRAIWNLVRQFVLTGQSNPWKDLDAPTSTEGRVGVLLGYPAYEASAMDATPATNNEIAILGDFSRFIIVDRIGLSVDVIPHLFGTNHRPTGQRGLYAFWRNGSKVVDANAFRVLLGIV